MTKLEDLLVDFVAWGGENHATLMRQLGREYLDDLYKSGRRLDLIRLYETEIRVKKV